MKSIYAACLLWPALLTPALAGACPPGQIFRTSKNICMDKAEAVKLGIIHAAPKSGATPKPIQPAEAPAEPEPEPAPVEASAPPPSPPQAREQFAPPVAPQPAPQAAQEALRSPSPFGALDVHAFDHKL